MHFYRRSVLRLLDLLHPVKEGVKGGGVRHGVNGRGEGVKG